jgi:hypothetical protein
VVLTPNPKLKKTDYIGCDVCSSGRRLDDAALVADLLQDLLEHLQVFGLKSAGILIVGLKHLSN